MNKSEVFERASKAKDAARLLSNLSTEVKNNALLAMADALEQETDTIIQSNKIDVEIGKEKNLPAALVDRLVLNESRIKGMADGLREVAELPDPVGKVISMWRRPNGLEIGRRRVPLGVVGIIYEARPNVTVDAAGLALKAGNAALLRGSSEAINSNKAIVKIIKSAARGKGIPPGAIELIERTDRKAVEEMMKLRGYIDVLIPRGGPGLIKAVVENSIVPVIETGAGNCHTYIEASADLKMAKAIAFNAKTHRPGVCNAMETLLVDKRIAQEFLPELVKVLQEAGVDIRGCEETCKIVTNIKRANEDDWSTEYLDLTLAVKIVNGIDEAIAHINKYSTKHSEAIVTRDYNMSRRFLEEVDAAAVYVNASTRFTDGNQFGLGAEMGISTQKLHARGPMGLEELTTTKFVIYGNGQIRK